MSSMPPYSVENWPMLRVATRPPMWATGLDCGEWPVVSPCSRTRSSSACSGTPHWQVACMLYGSTLTIWFIVDPSMITESGTTLSSPPSVAVPPVRGMTLTPFSFAQRQDLGDLGRVGRQHYGGRHRHGVHVEDVLQLAEVVDAALDEDLLVGDHGLRPHDAAAGPRRWLLCSVACRRSFAFRGWALGQWKMEKDCSRIGSVASWMAR